MSAWIRMITDAEADEDLLDALSLSRTPHGTVDNVLRVHSLRPATMRGHMTLYRAVLHDAGNSLPAWFQETISSYVSILNDCEYSLANHWSNARHLIGDDARADAIEAAMFARRPDEAFDGAELALLRYAEKLTLRPGEMDQADVDALRSAGDDRHPIIQLSHRYAPYLPKCSSANQRPTAVRRSSSSNWPSI